MSEQPLFSLLSSAVLLEHRKATLKQVLCVADENTPAAELVQCFAPLPVSPVLYLTNRYDLAQALGEHGEALLSDFDFNAILAATLQLITFRISKERSLVHHVLLGALRSLAVGGKLFLVGRKNEGIKNYFDLCRKTLGFTGTIRKQGDAYFCELTKNTAFELAPNTQKKLNTYGNEKCISIEGVAFQSKPGIFGWNKLDQGSAFLIQQLQALHLPANTRHLLDLGCGYGYLALRAASLLQPKALTATDNNFTAVAYCRENLARQFNNEHYTATVDDCGAALNHKFDLILCNPPFHQGSSHDFSLTQKFLRSAKRLLAPGGSALFVFNAFVPAEKTAEQLFSGVQQIANNKQFKVYKFTG